MAQRVSSRQRRDGVRFHKQRGPEPTRTASWCAGELVVSCRGLAHRRIRLYAEGDVRQYGLLLVESWLTLACLETSTNSVQRP
jgi:hypothetical protein